MSKIRTTLTAAALYPLISSLAFGSEESRPPNILVIVTDDQGYADFGSSPHAAKDIATPHMDRIAKEGVLFTQAYVSAPVCSPSRAGWNTGRYQQRWGHYGWGAKLPKDVPLLAEYLQDAGYYTGKTGKNDFGSGGKSPEARGYPLSHGYNEFLGFTGHHHDYFALSEEVETRADALGVSSGSAGPLSLNGGRKEFPGQYTTEVFTDWAIEFMETHGKAEKPFFLNVSYNSLHLLIHEVPERYLKKYGVEARPGYDPEKDGDYGNYYKRYSHIGTINEEDTRKFYRAHLNCLDDNIGRLLAALDASGLSENTLVIFFSDNGGSPNTASDNRPLRGSKYGVFEGGIRIPFALRWPKRFAGGQVYPHRVSSLDVLPTCLDAAGSPASEKDLDGASFLGALKHGEASPSSKHPMFWDFNNRWVVRDGDWKLVSMSGGSKHSTIILGGPKLEKGVPALFKLSEDLSEQKNLASEHPEIVRRLSALRSDWLTQMAPRPEK